MDLSGIGEKHHESSQVSDEEELEQAMEMRKMERGKGLSI